LIQVGYKGNLGESPVYTEESGARLVSNFLFNWVFDLCVDMVNAGLFFLWRTQWLDLVQLSLITGQFAYVPVSRNPILQLFQRWDI